MKLKMRSIVPVALAVIGLNLLACKPAQQTIEDSGSSEAGLGWTPNRDYKGLLDKIEAKSSEMKTVRGKHSDASKLVSECNQAYEDARAEIEKSDAKWRKPVLSAPYTEAQCERYLNDRDTQSKKIDELQSEIQDLQRKAEALGKQIQSQKIAGQRERFNAANGLYNQKLRDAAQLEKDYTSWQCKTKLSPGWGSELDRLVRDQRRNQCLQLLDKSAAIAKEIDGAQLKMLNAKIGLTNALLEGEGKAGPLQPELTELPETRKPGCFAIKGGSSKLFADANVQSSELTPSTGDTKGKQGFAVGVGAVYYAHSFTGDFTKVTIKSGSFLGREGYLNLSALTVSRTTCPN